VTTPARFAQPIQLDQLADALGDPTRRAIFTHVTAAGEPLTASDVGTSFGIHRTVARAHLERLVETGLLACQARHRPEGGRPPKVYARNERRVDVQLPPRQYELLAGLLPETLDRFGDAAEVLAQQVGLSFGRRLALADGGGTVLSRLQPLTDAGADFDAHLVDDRVEIQMRNCLFHELARQRPGLVCTIDRAILQGLLSLGADDYVLDQVTRTEAGRHCHLVFRTVSPPPDAPAPTL
jgi:predicted ArsR family transcriptional regulator